MNTRIIDRLVSHVLDTPFETFDAEHILAAKKRLIDSLGCALSGVEVSGNAAMLNLVRSWAGAPEAGVVGRTDRLPLPFAAMINSLQTRSFDFEVCGPEPEGVNAGKMVGHVGSTTEPVALSVGEFTHADGKELLAAVILGGDVAARVSVSNKFSFESCFEVCGTSNAFGATAIAGRLMGLDHDQLRNAFGILLNLMAGSFQGIWDGVDSFKLPGATAAYNGILACQLSRNGFGGVGDALESRLGYFSMYCKDATPESMITDLGQVFYVHGQHKLHPSCYGNHNAIECVLELHREHSFDPSSVRKVYLDVPPNRIDHFLNQVPTATDAQPRFLFNLPYAIANAIVRGTPELEHYVAPAIRDPAVLDLAARVELVPNLPLGKNHSNRLRLVLDDGREIESYREDPVGWLDDPTPLELIIDKFRRNARFSQTISEDQVTQALALIDDLENLSDTAALAGALTLGDPAAAQSRRTASALA